MIVYRQLTIPISEAVREGRRMDKDTWKYTLDSEPDLFAGRGFTSHEFLPCFNLYNMNGRLYDPLVGRFLSPDNYVQFPDFTQNFNRYSYALNNPLKYNDPSGEFIFTLLAVITGQWWALPITIGADIGAITGGIRGANTEGKTFWGGAWRGATVGAVGGGLSMIGGAGMPFIANLALGMGEGAITGGLDAALWGNDIGKGMLWGAAAGAVFTTLTSENFRNWTKGKGFLTNENVFKDFRLGRYTACGDNWQCDALDYFGFEGEYHEGFFDNPGYNQKGITYYGEDAFNNYQDLKHVYIKESFHTKRWPNWNKFNMFKGSTDYIPEDKLGHIFAYKNSGLYPNSLIIDFRSIINLESQIEILQLNQTCFDYKWWHFIYKIPRRW